MNQKKITKKIKTWSYCNASAIALVFLFILVYAVTKHTENAFLIFGTTGIKYLNGEYYRYLTCLFLHNNLRHLFANSAGILAAGSLLGPFIKKRQILFLFFGGGILSEIAYSIVISDPIYDIGASSGIFALIACLIVCCLRFPKQFHLKCYRPDIIIVLLYFIFANSSVSSFLVHVFGFAAGILISFAMVQTGVLHLAEQDT